MSEVNQAWRRGGYGPEPNPGDGEGKTGMGYIDSRTGLPVAKTQYPPDKTEGVKDGA